MLYTLKADISVCPTMRKYCPIKMLKFYIFVFELPKMGTKKPHTTFRQMLGMQHMLWKAVQTIIMNLLQK